MSVKDINKTIEQLVKEYKESVLTYEKIIKIFPKAPSGPNIKKLLALIQSKIDDETFSDKIDKAITYLNNLFYMLVEPFIGEGINKDTSVIAPLGITGT